MTTLDATPAGTQHAPHVPAQLSREQILAATSRCLRDCGYDATTIRKIASVLNCAVGSIYRYFDDKRELLSVVTQQTLGPVAEAIEGGASLEDSARLYHELMSPMPETYRLMFWLSCPPGSAPDNTSTPGGGSQSDGRAPAAASADACNLPGVVQRIIAGWAGQLGDAATAERGWAILHGMILMGRGVEETIASVAQAAEARGSHARRGESRHAAPRPAPAVPEIVITMKEPPPPARAAAAIAHPTPTGASKPDGAAADDVCLL